MSRQKLISFLALHLLLALLLIGQHVSAQTITSISPQCVTAGGGDFTLTVTGTNYNGSSLIYVNGVERATIVNGNTLTTTIPASLIASFGTLNIQASRGSNLSTAFSLYVLRAPGVTAGSRCGPGTVNLSASGAPAGGNYRWYTAASGGSVIGTGATFTTPSISSTTTYYVAMVSPGPMGCEIASRAAVTATINTIPTASITTTTPTTFCTGGSVTLTAVASPASPSSGNYTYQWRNNGTNISGATSATYNATTAGNYSVVITNPQGNCPSAPSSAVTVTVNPRPAAPTTTSAARCGSGSVTLTAAGAPAGGSYRWYTTLTGGTAIDGATGATYNTPNLITTTNYYVAAVSAEGCEGTARTLVTATINPDPTVKVNNPAPVCDGASVNLLSAAITSGSTSGLTYTYWTDAAATTELANPGAVTVSGTYYIKGTTAAGCFDIKPVTVTIKPLPTITVTENQTICVGESVTLTATGAESYTWAPATGLSSTTGSSVSANPTQTTTYTVIGTTNGCQSEAKTVTVTVNELPDASITLRGPAVFCPENYVDLVAVSELGYTYSWFRLNSDGSSTAVASSAEGPHIYSATSTGSYYVRITSDKGCVQTSEAVAVQVANVPNTATIGIVGPTTFCEGGTVRFNANQSPTSDPYSYQWQISTTTTDDNAFTDIAGAEGSSFTATEPGYYRVLVSNTAESTPDVEKCTKISNPVQVTVLPQPQAQIQGGNQSICRDPSGTTTFFLEGEYSGGDYQWISNKGGWVITELPNSEPGKLSIRVDVNDGNPAATATITLRSRNTTSSCVTAMSSVNLTLKPIPNTTITANRPIATGGTVTLCKGDAVILTANPATGNYLWSNGATTRTITVTEAGNYTVTVTNSSDCPITSSPVTVVVNELPVVTIDSQLDNAYCKSAAAVPLTGSPANGTFRILQGSNVIVANATQLDPGALAAGSYTIEYGFTDGNTCTNTATKTVTINSLPTVSIVQPSKAAYCTSEAAVTLAGNHVGGSFTINGQSVTTFNPASLGPGTYTIVYTYSDGNGCANTATKDVTVNPLPTASINFTGPTTFCQGGSLVLTGNSDSGTSFTWYRNDVQVGTGPTYTANTTGSYTVRATNANTCTSEKSAAVAVTVNATITGNSISGTQTVCSGATIAPLGQAAGTSLAGGATPYTYQWEQRIGTSGAWTTIEGATSASYTPPVQTVASATTIFYRRIVSGGSCSSTSTQNISVTINPTPTISGFSLGSDSDSDGDGKFADVYTGQGTLALAGNPMGGVFRINGGTTNVTSFNPCALGAGTHTITYTLTSGTSPNQCTTTVSKTVTVKQSAYTVVITTNPFPVCRGQNTEYTAHVYRDIERVVYPYMADASGWPLNAQGNRVADGEEPAPNPEYIANYVPANTPDIIKQYAYRYFEAVVIMGNGVKVNENDSGASGANLFNYGWTRSRSDGSTMANNTRTRNFAGLSATDWVAVWVNPKNSNTTCGSGVGELSSRIYFSEPQGYTMTLNSVAAWCHDPANQSDVTLTANLGALAAGWQEVTIEWYLRRTGTADALLGTTNGPNGNTISLSVPRSTFQNGDQVYLKYTSAIDTYADSKCASDPRAIQPITIRIDQPATFTTNLSTAQQTLCEGGTATFQVSANGTNLQYVWYRSGVAISNGGKYTIQNTATGSTLTITGVGTGDTGNYYVQVSNASTAVCAVSLQSDTAPLTVNPIPQLRTVNGPPFCPVTQPDGTLITLENSESGVTYTLTKVGDPSFTPVTRTGTGSSTEPLSFGTFAAGTYSISGTNSNSCSTPKVGEVTVTTVSYPVVAGELEVFWRDNTTNWEVVANSDHITKGVAMNGNFVYEWYVGADEGSATLFTTTNYPDNSIMINNPAEGLFVRCIIRTPSGICLPDVIMDNRGIIPLPVELIYFKGVRKDNTVVLTWATASEKDNAGFELQVSQDNKNYRQLEFVPSKNGTSSLKQLYEFIDRENGKYGTRYYRLKQLDLDGKFTYYGPVAVAFGDASNKAIVYPNPFEREVKLEIDSEKATVMELAVTNLQGRQLMVKNVKVEQGKNTITLDLGPDLPAGIYILTTRFNGTSNNFKLLKQ